MDNKIDIAKLLKGCPSGMELDCTMYENVYFDRIVDNNSCYKIECHAICDGIKLPLEFSIFGASTLDKNAKCVIFPKGKTTWEGFEPPCTFKDGDILHIDCNFDEDTHKDNQYIFILKEISDSKIYCYCFIDKVNKYKKFDECWLSDMIYPLRFATEEEKQKLFDAIRENGYKWNAETKTLERLIVPKFKAGDRVARKDGIGVSVLITEVGNAVYFSENENSTRVFTFCIRDQDDYVLVPNKFDISTLKPFESKVLIRDEMTEKWKPAIWGFYSDTTPAYPYGILGGNIFRMCIPFEGNGHLLGKTDDCSEYYKTWGDK